MGVRLVGSRDSAEVHVRPVGPFEGTWERQAVWELMTPLSALVTVAPTVSCEAADALAREHGVRHLLVVEGENLLGVICRCDLHPLPRFDEPVGTRMNRDVLGIDAGATLKDAASAIATLGIGILPVFRHGRLSGMLSRGDLRRAGVPEALLGARQCCNCSSTHGVRTWTHGCDYCIECIDLLDAFEDDEEFGEGD